MKSFPDDLSVPVLADVVVVRYSMLSCDVYTDLPVVKGDQIAKATLILAPAAYE